jgi:hypothetical protein
MIRPKGSVERSATFFQRDPSVPKVTVDKDRNPLSQKYKIWGAIQNRKLFRIGQFRFYQTCLEDCLARRAGSTNRAHSHGDFARRTNHPQD